jgi:hypothetical protein
MSPGIVGLAIGHHDNFLRRRCCPADAFKTSYKSVSAVINRYDDGNIRQAVPG